MRLVSYARTSGSGNGQDSLDAQGEHNVACAVRHGHEVVAFFRDEYVCGGLPVEARPGLFAAVAAIEDGIADGLVVHRLDRLARELHVQEAALARVWGVGARIVVYEAVEDGIVKRDDPDDPQRRFIRQVLGAAAEFERGLGVARMRGGRQRKAARGGYIGGFRPYGYRVVEREFVPEPVEQAVIATIIALRRGSPPMAYKEIAACLNADECPSPSGGVWGPQTVLNIYQREGRTTA